MAKITKRISKERKEHFLKERKAKVVKVKKPVLSLEEKQHKLRINFVKAALRRASLRWKPRYTVLNNAYAGNRESLISGRDCKHFRCAECGIEVPMTLINLDHIVPVGHVSSNWDWIERLFCYEAGFQVLCVWDHAKKSFGESK